MLVLAIVQKVEKAKTRQLVELDTQVLATVGNAISASQYVAQRDQWNVMARSIGQFFQKYDLYLTPTCAQLRFKIGEMKLGATNRSAAKLITRLNLEKVLLSTGRLQKSGLNALVKNPFTQLANLTGLPAISLPIFMSDQGQPMGDELTLLTLANEIEEASPWIDRKPNLIQNNSSK